MQFLLEPGVDLLCVVVVVIPRVDGDPFDQLRRHVVRQRMDGIMRYRGVDFGRVLRDASGDMHVLEMYLSMGRQKRALSAAVDHYLKDKVVRSASALELDRSDVLEEHDGEVWISGGCEWRLQPKHGPSMR